MAQLRARAVTRALQGEVTLVIAGGAAPAEPPAEDLTTAIARLRGEGMSLKEVARVLARDRGLPRRQVYQVGVALAADRDKP